MSLDWRLFRVAARVLSVNLCNSSLSFPSQAKQIFKNLAVHVEVSIQDDPSQP